MPPLDSSHLERTLQTLDASVNALHQADPDSLDYEIYRNAVIKGFELTLELSGKLLRRALKAYAGNPRAVDELSYKDVFRHAAKHGLLTSDRVERWFQYRDNRNNTAHDYGVAFANETLSLLTQFSQDVRWLISQLNDHD